MDRQLTDARARVQASEAWRFTPAPVLFKTEWAAAERPARRGGFGGRALCPVSFHRIVVHNGRVEAEGSRVGPLPAGVSIQSFAEARAASIAVAEDAPPFALAAAESAGDGVVVRVGRHAKLDKPLQILLASDDSESRKPQSAHVRVQLLLEDGAQAEIVEEAVGGGEVPFWTNLLTQVSLGEGASLKHYRLQREGAAGLQTSATLVDVGRSARYESHVFSFGGAFARADLRVKLAGEGAECALNGLALTRGAELSNADLVLEHAAVGGTARVLYKAVLDEKSRYVFDGLARVRPGAQKTDASIYNKNLLLSEEAVVHTNPEFEIHADDVSCKHGGAIGQLSTDSLFYLRSRGLDEAEARRMLVYAFGAEMLGRVTLEPLKEALEAALMARMPEAGER